MKEVQKTQARSAAWTCSPPPCPRRGWWRWPQQEGRSVGQPGITSAGRRWSGLSTQLPGCWRWRPWFDFRNDTEQGEDYNCLSLKTGNEKWNNSWVELQCTSYETSCPCKYQQQPLLRLRGLCSIFYKRDILDIIGLISAPGMHFVQIFLFILSLIPPQSFCTSQNVPQTAVAPVPSFSRSARDASASKDTTHNMSPYHEVLIANPRVLTLLSWPSNQVLHRCKKALTGGGAGVSTSNPCLFHNFFHYCKTRVEHRNISKKHVCVYI